MCLEQIINPLTNHQKEQIIHEFYFYFFNILGQKMYNSQF